MAKKPIKPSEQKQTEQAPQPQREQFNPGRGQTAADIRPLSPDERGPSSADIYQEIDFDRVIPPEDRE